MSWFNKFLSPDSVSGRIALVALGSAAAIGAGILYVTNANRAEENVVEEQEEEEEEEKCEEEEEEEIQVSAPSLQTVTASAPQQIFVSEVEAEKFALLLIILVMCMTMVLSSVDHVAPTDYRLFVPLLMTGTGLYGASKIPKEKSIKNSNKCPKNKEEKRLPEAIPTAAPSSSSSESSVINSIYGFIIKERGFINEGRGRGREAIRKWTHEQSSGWWKSS